MGNDICSWFDVIPPTAPVVGSVVEGERMLPAWSTHRGVYRWKWGDEGKNKGAKVGNKGGRGGGGDEESCHHLHCAMTTMMMS